MIDKRLFQLVEKKQLIQLVLVRLVSLGLSIVLWFLFSAALAEYLAGDVINIWLLLAGVVVILVGKSVLTKAAEALTYHSSAELRLKIRSAVMKKAFRMGQGQGQLSSSALAQLSVDGIEQLEIYYARFLPQFFYCMLASLLVFGVLAGFAWPPALALLICMPLIPLVIMGVMKIAKRILSSYWNRYTNLGTKFHENLNGLSTLKAYNQDEFKQKEAAADAQRFRKVTMSLLSMQLNSITIMDIISYSGAAMGIGLALFAYQENSISTTGMLMFLLLSAEFFIPMRQLGSLFHVAMNGISACSKLFDYLALPEQPYGAVCDQEQLYKLQVNDLHFSYGDTDDDDLYISSAVFKKGSFSALVGKSGSGKSTFVRLLLHQLSGYEGEIRWNDTLLSDLSEASVKSRSVLVDNHGYLYPKTIRENLLLANPLADEQQLWTVLEQVHLRTFIEQLPLQLDEKLSENGNNLSGGQRQRLLLARSLLRQADLYVFDEITSGIDLASEEIILDVLKALGKTSIVLFISHRLYNVVNADQLLIFDKGQLVETGVPEELAIHSSYYKNYFSEEHQLLHKGGVSDEAI